MALGACVPYGTGRMRAASNRAGPRTSNTLRSQCCFGGMLSIMPMGSRGCRVSHMLHLVAPGPALHRHAGSARAWQVLAGYDRKDRREVREAQEQKKVGVLWADA